jgi:hypothetical protein
MTWRARAATDHVAERVGPDALAAILSGVAGAIVVVLLALLLATGLG